MVLLDSANHTACYSPVRWKPPSRPWSSRGARGVSTRSAKRWWTATGGSPTTSPSIGATAGRRACRPKGLLITHRHAHLNVVGPLLHFKMTCADRYLWTLPMFHANGWTFVWTVTAAGGVHVCLRKVEPRAVFERIAAERITTLCAAP